MDYIDALKKSTGWIQKYYKEFTPQNIDFEDYSQECMLYFWGTLKPRFSAELCWGYSKIAYKRVMIKMLYRTNANKIKTISLTPVEEYISSPSEENFEWTIYLRPSYKKVAELIADGYETKEIAEITNKTIQSIYSDIKFIKKAYAEHLGIKDYQRKHLRHFTRNRTEKEIECRKNLAKMGQAKLKANKEFEKKAKCLQTQEKSRQCVI